jgi:hypothetical protein
LVKGGWEPVSQWRSCYYHKALRLFLVVYADDFKMSGPQGNLAKGWKLVRQHVKTDEPLPLDKYLGCEHRSSNVPASSFADSARELFHWPPLPTEAKEPPASKGGGSDAASRARNASSYEGLGDVRLLEYDMSEFFRSCVEKYVELAGKNARPLRKVDTPFLDEASGGDAGDDAAGELQPIAARVLMKVLYGARMARYDLLRPCCFLATKITKWTRSCDKALHRLMCYLHSTPDTRMCGWVGDDVKSWELVLYADADFAGDRETPVRPAGCFCASAGLGRSSPLPPSPSARAA